MSSDELPLYRNAMETLVAKEVQRQLQSLTPRLVRYINRDQVIAYALNRLPSLYATSEKGWQLQQQRVENQLHSEVVSAVRQGIAAVQRDPFRVATPLRNLDEVESS